MGEFETIARIRQMAEKIGTFKPVSLGIGDDCCLLEAAGDEEFALSTDAFVEGVHFRLDYFDYYQVGVKAAAASLSDLAAMGAEPAGALAAVSIRREDAETAIEDLAGGLIETCGRYDCPLVGGDLTASPGPLVVTVTVAGRVKKGQAILRSTAQPGDEIWVSGTPGDAGAVLAVLEQRRKSKTASLPEFDSTLLGRLLSPIPRLAEARLLRQAGPPTAMIDISDGLAADLNHILEDSGLGALLFARKFPLGEFQQSVAAVLGLPKDHFFLHGGEDYELLLTIPPGVLSKDAGDVREITGTALHRIGRLTGKKGELIVQREDGRFEALRKTGFDHFSSIHSGR
ncbi:MAG: thiamine-phosphate kinase [Candidatus Glassbacteria bacterium RIFCSPLOWO2_12_FULL_58_11]|uniref:Thiamine-monophosphate kinase n=1 Tax=Candidatus Glassbacteria bacterium RIFCSPLOWO2_12_FULL_58_11 TaxID=1817867 RepID=A0A1F5YM51_9BACT|nr:MAG: thiamine-phosphate kinase [Candidatus Glassbacteria bacterium RIFCSPLOWO2_12_FULL_58_11]